MSRRDKTHRDKHISMWYYFTEKHYKYFLNNIYSISMSITVAGTHKLQRFNEDKQSWRFLLCRRSGRRAKFTHI